MVILALWTAVVLGATAVTASATETTDASAKKSSAIGKGQVKKAKTKESKTLTSVVVDEEADLTGDESNDVTIEDSSEVSKDNDKSEIKKSDKGSGNSDKSKDANKDNDKDNSGIGHYPVTICHKPGTPAEKNLTVDAMALGSVLESLRAELGLTASSDNLSKKDFQALTLLKPEDIRAGVAGSVPNFDNPNLAAVVERIAKSSSTIDVDGVVTKILSTDVNKHLGHGDTIGACTKAPVTKTETPTTTDAPKVTTPTTEVPTTIALDKNTDVKGKTEARTLEAAPAQEKPTSGGMLALTGASTMRTVMLGIGLWLVGLAALAMSRLRSPIRDLMFGIAPRS